MAKWLSFSLFLVALVQGEVLQAKDNTDFDPSIPFMEGHSLKMVRAQIKKEGKPALVFVTEVGCPACNGLKGSINEDGETKKMMDKFVLANVPIQDGGDWEVPGRSDGYVPRVYFLDLQGNFVEQHSPYKQWPFYFSSSDQVADAMRAAAKKIGRPYLLQSSPRKAKISLRSKRRVLAPSFPRKAIQKGLLLPKVA